MPAARRRRTAERNGAAWVLPSFVRQFVATESAGAIVLVVAVAVALAWANSPWQDGYAAVWREPLVLHVAGARVTPDLRGGVNDGLMALFFLLVGLELKRELVHGDLTDRRVAAVPVLGALGGMVVPAVLYRLMTIGSGAGHGWGVPMATDIAFALAALTLVRRDLPNTLKVMMLTLAIVDDVGAIVVIALFYGGTIHLVALATAAACVLAALALHRAGVNWAPAHVLLALVGWWATYRSGVHATIAGVAFALVMPASPRDGNSRSEQLEQRLHPLTSLVVLPLFALANAGVVVRHGMLDHPDAIAVASGVVAGLVVGKFTGVLAGSWLAVRLGAALPDGVRWRHLAGLAGLAGIGFTVSIFVATLAFDSVDVTDAATLAVLVASVCSAAVGTGLLARATR